eukprot:403366505
MPLTQISSADYYNLMFGILAGVGYGVDAVLGECQDAGLELFASGFMTYNWITHPNYELYERILGPIPDIFQIGLQLIYSYQCITKQNVIKIFGLVEITKLVQSTLALYLATSSFQPSSPKYDLFLAPFAVLKAMFNVFEAIGFFNDPNY